MTEDELDIETLRYRGPTVVPLSGGRLGILTPGAGEPYVISDDIRKIWSVVDAYTKYNVLSPPTPKVATRVALLANISDEVLEAALRAVQEGRA